MAKLTEVTIPVLRIQKDSWSDTYYVQQRQGNGRWKRVSDDYNHITSAKAKLGNVVLERYNVGVAFGPLPPDIKHRRGNYMILFFDTETTGIRKGGFVPRVVQVGALLTDNEGKTLGELNVLLLPEGFENIPVEASNVHGFTTELIKKCGIDRVAGLSAFFSMAERADVLVAHNAEYDMDLMQIEIDYYKNIHNLPEATMWQEVLSESKVFCTMLNSRDLMKLPLSEAQASFFKDKGIDQQYKNPRLQEAHIHYMGYDFEGAHDAMADVRACKDVYFKLHSLKEAVAA